MRGTYQGPLQPGGVAGEAAQGSLLASTEVAKKTRTPPPPRRVQAPKVRTGKPAAAGIGRDRRMLVLYAVAASGLVALAIVLGVIFLGGSGDGEEGSGLAAELSAAGCTLRTVPGQRAAPDHSTVPTLQTRVRWNSSPPANGPHYGIPAVWGFYDEPVNPRQVVHNQEHGGVIIWYGPQVSQETKDQLRAFYQEDPNGMLATPYPQLGNKIALTAWTADPQRYMRSGYFGEGHIARCSRFDEDAFRAFRDEYRGKGPERIPINANTPGT
jgi:uncharacterized protein DUF3105